MSPLATRLKPLSGVPVRSEAAVHADILEMLRVAYPDVLVASIPNGGFVLDARIVQKLKWQGLLPGMPDLAIYWAPGGHGLLEVKSAVGRLSPEQKTVHEWLLSHGQRVAVVRSTEDLVSTLAEWQVPCRMTATR